MKRFDFGPLQKVLNLREFRENECKNELGKAIGILAEIENKIKETAVKRHGAAAQRFTDPLQMPVWDNYIIRLDRQAQNLTEQAAKAEIVVEEKRAEYLEAYKELKAIEKLKEKRLTGYKKEISDYRDAEADDLASARQLAQ
ncbi:MAG: flagellar export protein FliJ [Treponema sp.]|jgi:flagellar FliJ protein|nr:flagellar export protein FliJ [Treponema sp.]